jgi:hypothetical protein
MYRPATLTERIRNCWGVEFGSRRFHHSPVLVRDASGYKVISGHFQFHVAGKGPALNPSAGETIPAIVLESENQATASAMLKMLKFAA